MSSKMHPCEKLQRLMLSTTNDADMSENSVAHAMLKGAALLLQLQLL